MAEEEKEVGEGARQDSRLEFLSSYVLKTRRLKMDKWLRMMSKNEYKATVMEFLNEPSYKKLVFMVNNSGLLMTMSDLPENPQTKCSYFIRRTIPTLLTETNIREVLLCGDISSRPIDDLSVLVDHVFLPILNNPENHIGWTSAIETDVQIEFQKLRNSIAEYKGNMINRTLLPVPITIDDIMSLAPKITEGDISGLTVAMKDSLENVVLNWTEILSEFINQNQEDVILLNNLNACPKHLFAYWKNRLENLENIFKQFQSATIKTISNILEITKSVYLDVFKSSFISVVQALTQATDITTYLYPLEKLLENFDNANLIESSRLTEILMQNLCLVWSNCRHFAKNEQMAFLLKLVCNQIIEYAVKNLDSKSIFQTNIAESLNKMKEVLGFLYHFRKLYENYKQKLPEFKTKSSRPQYWTWKPETVFERFNIFAIRLEEIQNTLVKGLQFLQLEKIEIGGLEGRNISREFHRIFNQFENIYGEWRNISFDPLIVNGSVNFDAEKTKFNNKISRLEHEMSFQLIKTLRDCEDLNQVLQLIQVVETLMNHDIIREQFSTPLTDKILDLFQKELNIVRDLYNDIVSNFKKFGLADGQDLYFSINSGPLATVNKLRQRLAIPLKKFSSLTFLIFETEHGQHTFKNLNSLINILEEFEKELLTKCQDDLQRQVATGLEKPVLRRDGTHIFLNYPDELVIAMKGGKYFRRMNYVSPLNVIDVLNREEIFWEAKMKLQRIVEWYNFIINNTMQCEIDLINEEIKDIEQRLEPTFTTICWGKLDQSSIEHIFRILKRLNGHITEAQTNINSILKSIRLWAEIPLYRRKDGNPKAFLDIENRNIVIENRYMECFNTNEIIKQMLELNKNIFSNLIIESSANIGNSTELEADDTNLTLAVNSTSFLKRQNFRAYEEYVDELVGKELVQAALNSLVYIQNEMENRNNNENPLFEIKMELLDRDIVFTPSLDTTTEEGIYKRIETILFDIVSMTNVIPRVAQPINLSKVDELNIVEEIYDNIIENNEEVIKIRKDILKKVELAIVSIKNHLRIFDEYIYLWTMDRLLYLHNFKTYGRALEEEELALFGTDEFSVEIKEPALNSYRKEIEKFNSLYEKVNEWEDRREFDIWLRLDKKLFKLSILKQISKWCSMFKQDLINRVLDTIEEIDTFQKEATSTMNLQITKDDFEGLLNLMSILKKVNDNQLKYERMIEPLPAVIELLKYYNYEFSDEIFIQVQELPSTWMKTIKLAAIVKQHIAPIQSYQVDLLEKRIILFETRVAIFRNNFLKKPIFQVPSIEPYKICDEINNEILNLETRNMKLKESATSFNIKGPDDSKLHRCRKDLKMIKQVWDFVLAIETTIQNYQNTPWKDITVEIIDQECKNYLRELRMFDKDVRTWDPFIYAESILKNLITSLRAVTNLQNPAIRDRHWAELTATTNVTFKMDFSTKLSDLLKLNLHKFEEEVNSIVDKSVKEMGMEKVLFELNSVWSYLEFNTEAHQRTGTKLLKFSEEIIEILEDHQVQLQNLLSSKYIPHFVQEVTNWQIQLENVEQVIVSWIEIQRKWKYLESIFLGSEDIRNQLPEDTKRFKEIDREFKSMLNIMLKQKTILKLADITGIFSTLDRLNNELSICEKSLYDYLETKRLAYPRFYFISSADLLDILSNENNPDLVARHLPKMYDSLAKLSMVNGTKKANGMISKEHNELMQFIDHCNCTGKIEEWLNEITKSMKITLRWHFRKALAAYEDQPRHSWILQWQAQPALCTTQISWTTETNEAFKKLDHGYENAMKDFQNKQINQLNILINLLITDLTSGDRQKIMTICTIDVHSRDVVGKLITQRVDSAHSFQWQSQLRHRWDVTIEDCYVNICDAEFRYDYEYLGNTPRLVITPLTDRCYITLTQSLHLVMGGAPAGPAGTGKTETTKDLGRALGAMVYVFNCSEQMDYRSCGNIHKGLIQTGAWGCFDEFNRISVEVLSVVAVQVKSIQDAIKAKKKIFNFMGDMINLVPTVGLFITMNPGYAGRTELPENLKTLYRPCAMVVPDFALICEIMLVAEGFQGARLLARKFITLYSLCKELLSKQDHYDWGLRAIKSVLVVAGTLKRDDRYRPEDQVLMRALRDYNVPKIVSDDLPVFMGLIQDLFPAVDVPRKRNVDFENIVKQSAIDLHLQADEEFILKVIQLEELLAVRHSVFIIGNAGTGKTEVWRTLNKTYKNQRRRPVYNDLNPKVVTSDELFGIVNPSTREWKDGLFSIIMRDQANMSSTGPKWIVLDGDIDPMWIESLNTVMDDNKILTLSSNERIPLTKDMRLLFEISSLVTATPATVSRAGILYINQHDLGWSSYVASWINSRSNEIEKSILNVLCEKYVTSVLEIFRTRMKTITPISEISMIAMTCHLLDSFLIEENISHDSPKEWYEIYFVFCIIWGFGSALFQDEIIDWRNEFHKWWINEFKTVKFPSNGKIFDFYIDRESKKFVSWSLLVPEFILNPEVPLYATLVDTKDTVILKFFQNILIKKGCPIMLVGPTGSGKSVIMSATLDNLPEEFATTKIPFNFYTSSDDLQKLLEKPLEKKAGRNFGPLGNKKMIYFIDDLNMPEVDKYETVLPHTLIRQFMDYRHWYDKSKFTLKDIQKCQFVACMNPSAGSFTINPRLQRHFCTFAVNPARFESLHFILHSILSQHLSLPHNNFHLDTQGKCDLVVKTAIALHQKVAQTFLPTAVKFHYNFNLRDITNIFSGMLFANSDTSPTPDALIRLWLHEASRVYGDKLVDYEDINLFEKLTKDITNKTAEIYDDSFVFSKPIIYWHFSEGLADSKYMPIDNWEQLKNVLSEAILGYNDIVSSTNLVMFEDAMAHICRISRLLEGPKGCALLIGVGGSGKQSLTRLACFISSLEVMQPQITKDYGILDLKAEISQIYIKAGLKSLPCCFLMTDSQVTQEEFLVLVNDMLASGEIHELFTDDDVDNIVNSVRNAVKQMGVLDSRDNCWKYFIDKVRRLLKIVLCFSPVGTTLRTRARKFPAIINSTTIDWFHEWPKEALESVSLNFVSGLEILPENQTKSVAKFMAYVHGTVNDMSRVYLLNEKRYNYTTPKTFLELIGLYVKLLKQKSSQNTDRIFRLEMGLKKLIACSKEVDGLQNILQEQEIVMKSKNETADKLIELISAENEKIETERTFIYEEEHKVRIIEDDVTEKARLCEEDLHRAEPALIAAQNALNTLNKSNLTELKSFGNPPDAVVSVCAAVLILFSPKGKIPKDRSWRACKILMAKIDKFLDDLINYDKEHIQPEIIKALQPFLSNPQFNPEHILKKSSAAAGLCAWVININKFYEVFQIVEPKQKALLSAEKDLKSARDKLSSLNNRLKELEDKLNSIRIEYDAALTEKQKVQNEADQTAFTIDLAQRLITGLGSERVRWKDTILTLQEQKSKLTGDILLISCFISYVGCFTKLYRVELRTKFWLPSFHNLDPSIPSSANLDPFDMICDEAQIAEWNNEGLPTDRLSAENAAILLHSERYPLIIDPQLQGIKWIKNKFAQNLLITRLSDKLYLKVVEEAITTGAVLLIEDISETIDAVLEPVLSRSLVKKGTCIVIGDKEINFHTNFRLILQTKLSNPHFKPELQAQTTLINFTVTKDGLEDQLLSEVVNSERPDLEEMRSKLIEDQNNFKVTLKNLEDDLLQRLSSAGENILADTDLVLNLEKTKLTADEVENKARESEATAIEINDSRNFYRPVAKRASILYFVLNDLINMNPLYQYSLKAFVVIFQKALHKAPPARNIKDRLLNLIDSVTFSVHTYTLRGLFENDKITFMFHMTLQILFNDGDINHSVLDFLLKCPSITDLASPVTFLSDLNWRRVKALSNSNQFYGLDKDIEGSHKRWEKFVNAECPENEKFPGEWKTKPALEKLCIMRTLRPDRMVYAVKSFVAEKLGSKYVNSRTTDFQNAFEETSPTTHVFFILSPGVDPLQIVENLGKKLGFTVENGSLHSISLGQGQEILAENAIDIASQNGHWVVLQNIHLVAKWLQNLEKKLESIERSANEGYRLFLSAEPAPSPEYHVIPQGILNSAIKITNEPPSGMSSNLHKAIDNFSQETLEMCSKETEFKAILFSLCYFHSVVSERAKFGPQGWNHYYPFNFGDLTISVFVLYNYLESNAIIPWDDLKYLFGEIIYGGHITDNWDRRLCKTYLEEYMHQDLVDGELLFCEGFPVPQNMHLEDYHTYVDEVLPPEHPLLYGLHSNTDIGFLTTTSERLFKKVSELQPQMEGRLTRGIFSKESLVKEILEDMFDKIPVAFHLSEIVSRIENRSPYDTVFLQECERMNILMNRIKSSLIELNLGLKGELTLSENMEVLMESLLQNHIPYSWLKLANPTTYDLQAWFADLLIRLQQLDNWISDLRLPLSMWLGGFFNPQSFLTAIMQETARKNQWPLDGMCLVCEVTKKEKEELSSIPREGVYVNGLFMEGARWDAKLGTIADAKLKELFPPMPVIYIKAVTQDNQDIKNIYECPIYRTRIRGPTYVWTFNLKTKEKPSKWTLAGVCLLLQT